MNKILNWTFGACFRTLGRFLAIFIVFVLLLFVGSKLDLELPRWFAFEVSALEITQDVKLDGAKVLNYTNSDLQTRWIFQGKQFQSSNDLIYYQWFINSEYYDKEQDIDYIEIPLIIGQENISSTNEDNYLEYCIEWKKTSINGVEAYTCSNVSSTILDSLEYKPEVFLNNLNISFYVHHVQGTYATCQIKDSSILCPTQKQDIDFIGMFYSYKSNSTINYIPIYLGNVWQRYTITNFQEQINQNQQQTNDKLDDMNQTQNDIKDSINNDDTTGAQDSVGGFFDNFQIEDNGGISAIITAPLESIKAMLSTSCSPMTATFREKEIFFPCGYDFWNKMGAIRNFLNLVLDGMLCYAIIRKLYLTIDKLKNPEDDKVEVMKL